MVEQAYPILRKMNNLYQGEVILMSKYDRLWEHIKNNDSDTLLLSFEEIEKIAGVAIDHSFLNYKKELIDQGYQVSKISLKNQTVIFIKIKSPAVR